ncbi:MAG: hypothetical protein GY864_15190 [Desulfobacterales bacterium]|nr:hypothetical protein [Desulfobacterales bacterium]
MAEIKSTMDLIMEKTKGLTMTEEEKEALQKEEALGQVKGFLLKFLEGQRNPDRLKKEMASFEGKRNDMAREALIKECLDRMDPELDNERLFEALEHVAGVDPGPIREALQKFQQDLEQQIVGHEKRLRGNLEKRDISGTAVMPNINADTVWARHRSEMIEIFKENIDLAVSG